MNLLQGLRLPYSRYMGNINYSNSHKTTGRVEGRPVSPDISVTCERRAAEKNRMRRKIVKMPLTPLTVSGIIAFALLIVLLSLTVELNTILPGDPGAATAVILLSPVLCILAVITFFKRARDRNTREVLHDADTIEQWRNPKLLLEDVDRPHIAAGNLHTRFGSLSHCDHSTAPDDVNGSVVF